MSHRKHMRPLARHAGCLLCNFFWWIGHVWSHTLLHWWPWEWGSGAIYAVYNRSMLKSADLNDRGNCGVWGERELR